MIRISYFFAVAISFLSIDAVAQCLTVDPPVSVNVKCFGGRDGEITVSVSAGVAPFTYELKLFRPGIGETVIGQVNTAATSVTFKQGNSSLLPIFEASGIRANSAISAGSSYRINVSASGTSGDPLCEIVDVLGIVITQPTDITFSTTSVTPSCIGNDGAIQLSTSGGTPAYTYVWTGISPDPGNTDNPTGLAPGTYDVTVTDINNCSKQITGIVVASAPTVDAGSPIAICNGQTASLSGIVGGSATGGTWTTAGDGSFTAGITDTNLNTIYTPGATDLINGTVTLTLTTSGGTCPSIFDQVIITINAPATVEAGATQTVCSGSPATLAGSSFGGVATTSAWSIFSSPGGGDGVLSSTAQTANPSAITFVASVAGNYTLRLTTNEPAGPCTAVTDDVIVTVNQAATVNAGPATATVCAGSLRTFAGATIGGSATTGTWSIFSSPVGGNGVLSNTNPTATPATVTFSATVTGAYVLRLTTDDPAGICPAVFDNITITVQQAATVFAGADKLACAGSTVALSDATIGGSATNAQWTIRTQPMGGNGVLTPAAGFLVNPATATFTATVVGNYVLRLTTNNPAGSCNAVLDEVTIAIQQAPTVEAGNAQAICAGAIATLTGSSIGGSATNGTWTIQTQPGGGNGALTGPGPDNTPANATFTATVAGAYVLQLTTDDPANSCSAISDVVTITVNAVVVPTVSISELPLGAICAGTNVTFTATPTNQGTTPVYQWKKNGGNVGTNSTTYSDAALANGDQITVEMTSNATCPVPATVTSNTITMTVNPVLITSVSIAANSGVAICDGTSVTFTATPTNGGTLPTYQWKSNGSDIVGETGVTYTSTTLADGEQITVEMTSNAICPSSTTATSNTLTMDVTPTVVPSVSILDSPSGLICPNTNVTFTATPTNGGATPTYQWKSNGGNIGGETGVTYTSSTLVDGEQITVEMTSTAACPTVASVTSNIVTMQVGNPLAPSVSITPSVPSPICAGTNVIFTATPTNGGTTPAYQWLKNSAVLPGETASTYSDNSLADGDVVEVQMTSSLSCAVPTLASNTVVINVNAILVPSVTVNTSPSTSICTGTSVTFTANPTNGGVGPLYQWKKNGVDVPGETGVTFIDATLANGDLISVQLISNATCATPTSALSTDVNMTVNSIVAPSVAISANPGTTICDGTNVTFTATPTNGGALPTYQWKKNGAAISGAINATYSDAALADLDQITVEMTSNDACASPVLATSNMLAMSVNSALVPAVSIISDAGSSICAGATVTFTASPTNGGITPTYQWTKNGSNVIGETNVTFVDATLADTDVISVIMTSNATCAVPSTATSNLITMTVSTNLVPSVTITSDAGSTTICATTLVTFTASPINGGITPTYQWKKNGTDISGEVSATFADATLTSTDLITVVLTSSEACATPATATSNSLGFTVNPSVLPTALISSGSGTSICAGTSVTFTSALSNGGASPTYQWQKNNIDIAGETNSTYTDLGLLHDDEIKLLITSNATCPVPASVFSNMVKMSVTPVLVPSVTISSDVGTIICPSASVTFTASPTNGGTTPVYQWIKNGSNVSGATNSTYVDGSIGTGDVISVQMTSSEACPVPASSLSNNLTMTVGPAATVSIGGDASLCAGESVDVTLTFTGTPPWNITYTDGINPVNLSGIASSPHVITVTPSSSTTYTITSFSDACGVGTITDPSADVVVNPIVGDPLVAGSETWLGYVYTDVSSPGPAIDFSLAKYRGFIDANEIDNMTVASSYDASTDQFNLNLGNQSINGTNICGAYANDFSVRFRMDKTFAAGVYTFTLGSDDGVRMFVDGNPVTFTPASTFTLHSYATFASDAIALSAGIHSLVIEYFERTGQSRISFAYAQAAGPSLSSTGDVCINSTAPTLTASTTDPSVIGFNWYSDAGLTTLVASTAAYVPTSPSELDLTTSGATTFYATAVYASGESQASSIVVNVFDAGTITASDVIVCVGSGIVDMTTLVSATPSGGMFGFIGDGVTGVNFDPTLVVLESVTPIAVSYTNGSCLANANFNITVTGGAVVTLVTPNPGVCESGGLVDLNAFVSAIPAGGDFIFAGTQVNSATDEFDPSTLSGSQPITVDYSVGGCVATQVILTVDVITTPTFILANAAVPVCENDAALDLTTNIQSSSPAGGTFTFLGAPNIFGNTFDPAGLPSGTYVVTVEYDVTGCTLASQTFNIVISPIPSITVNNTTVVCQNDADVDLSSLVTGAPALGSFAFSGLGVTGNLFTPGVLAGDQTITATYTQSGCPVSSPLIIKVNTRPDANSAVSAFPSLVCAGGSSAIVVNSTNNVVYQLRLNSDNSTVGGAFLGNGFSINLPTADLTAATQFNVLATNLDGTCPTQLMNLVTVSTRAANDPLCGSGGGGTGTGTCAAVVIVPEPLPATCTNSDGSIIFHIKPFVPLINNTGVSIDITGVSPTNQTISRTLFNDTVFTALPIGTYDFVIEYGDPGCVKSGQVTIDRSGTIGVPVVSNITTPVCTGDASASFILDVPGETGNLLQWSTDGINFTDFNAGSTIVGFVAGNHTISVRRTAADPCNAGVTLFIPDGLIEPVQLVSAIKQDASCDGADGSVVVNLSGGAAPFNYKFGVTGNEFDIADLPTNNTFDALAPNNYSLIVTDASGCAAQTFNLPTVGFPGIVGTNNVIATDPDCSGDGSNGSIAFNIDNNFAGQFQFAVFTDFSITPVDADFITASPNPVFIPNLAAGDYFVWVRSINALCPTRIDPTFTRLRGAIKIAFEAQAVNEKCFGEGGAIDLSAIVGVQDVDYEYLLNTGGVTQTGTITYTESLLSPQISGLPKGAYELILRQNSVLSCESNAFVDLVIDGPVSPLNIEEPTIPNSNQETAFEDDPTAARVFVVTGGDPVYFMNLVNSLDQEVRPATEVLLVNTSYSLQYSGLGPGTFTAKVTDDFGCLAEREFVIGLKTDIFIPNIFTPDNDPDQRNEVFFIRNLVGDSQLVITNRWGNEVYSSKNYQNDWDAEGVSDGIYYYSLKSGGQVFTGWVEILRGNRP